MIQSGLLSPNWRSLNPLKGHLTIPKMSLWITRYDSLYFLVSTFDHLGLSLKFTKYDQHRQPTNLYLQYIPWLVHRDSQCRILIPSRRLGIAAALFTSMAKPTKVTQRFWWHGWGDILIENFPIPLHPPFTVGHRSSSRCPVLLSVQSTLPDLRVGDQGPEAVVVLRNGCLGLIMMHYKS